MPKRRGSLLSSSTLFLTLILSVNLRVSGVESSNKSVDEFSYNSFFHLLDWKKCDKINYK